METIYGLPLLMSDNYIGFNKFLFLGKMMFSLSIQSEKNMSGCDPRLKQVAYRAIEITPIDFGIPSTGGLRTTDEQNKLFRMGRSKCDGYTNLSKHQASSVSEWSKAIDFYAYKNGHANWNKHYLAVIAGAFLQSACEMGYVLNWGGLWITFKDYPHIQINEELVKL